MGNRALAFTTTGYGNVAVGFWALHDNTTGHGNVAVGEIALDENTTGDYNTAVGLAALSIITGSENTRVGAQPIQVGFTIDNASAVGYQAFNSASNQVRLGNSSVTSIGGYTNWSNISDGRVKKNIKQNVPGLAFTTAGEVYR